MRATPGRGIRLGFRLRHVPYMARQRSTSQKHTNPFASSTLTLCAKRSVSARNLLIEAGEYIIKTRWSLVEYITAITVKRQR